MITFEQPKEHVVGIGEHIEGIGTVLDPDDFPAGHVEAMRRQTAQIDSSIRRMRMQIADGYISTKKQFMTDRGAKGMNRKAIALALATALSMTLTSCGSVTHEPKVTSEKLYKATMYSDGSIVREWHGITYYSSYGNVGVKIYFNDDINEIGTMIIGEVVVEPEDDAEK